jgi:hypothetical protein
MLEDASRYPLSGWLIEGVRDDVRAWHNAIQAECRSLSDDVEDTGRIDVDGRHRLTQRLEALDRHIGEVLARRRSDDITVADYESFYRYLGCLRGVSEAGINYARLAGTVSWGALSEERF